MEACEAQEGTLAVAVPEEPASSGSITVTGVLVVLVQVGVGVSIISWIVSVCERLRRKLGGSIYVTVTHDPLGRWEIENHKTAIPAIRDRVLALDEHGARFIDTPESSAGSLKEILEAIRDMGA
jgi:hypothetical protein